jgi:hypothetical protein
MNKKWKHQILRLRKYKAKEMRKKEEKDMQRQRRENQCHIGRSRKQTKK